MGPHISIKGELIATIAGFPITNSLLTTWLVVILFCVAAYIFYQDSQKTEKSYFYFAIISVLRLLYNLFSSVLHKNTALFFPLLASFFFFIVLNNWSGLLPGVGTIKVTPAIHAETVDTAQTDEHFPLKENDDHVVSDARDHGSVPLFRGGTADLNTTIALALVSVFLTQFFGFKFLGTGIHLKKYFNFKSPVLLFVGILELILEFARILSFSFRLFGNIFAGEVLLTVVPFLLPVALSFVSAPMFFMEVFVGVVQGLVFAMLSAVFISLAVSHH